MSGERHGRAMVSAARPAATAATPAATAARPDLDREAITRYVLGRRTPEGGYSFYRTPAWGVEEPNGPDTLAALESLRLLGVGVPDLAATAGYLRSLADSDGGYPSLTIGWAALRGLDVLGTGPARPPAAWLGGWAKKLLMDRAERSDWAGAVRDAARLSELVQLGAAQLSPADWAALGGLLEGARATDGGWARPGPDLETTAIAARLGMLAGFAPHDDRLLAGFLHSCSDPVLGLRLAPGAAAASVGGLWGGLVLAGVLGERVTYPEATARNLMLLQRPDGGLGARHRAISTLSDTWRGLDAARLLEDYQEELP
ncbi:MAG: hypothetical protein ACYCO9_10550 [Streptosporangiaceae bacterium]